jgi:PAS domain.
MQFPMARPDVVRAINQRWLLNIWGRHLHGHRVPRWQAVEAENLAALSDTLSFLDLIDRNGQTRFMVRFHGATISRVYGSADCRGRYLDEMIPPTACADALLPYHRTVECGCPVYTIHDVTDSNGRLVHYERLLPPFAHDGRKVDRILASFEFICADGAFDTEALLKTQSGPPALRLSAQIEVHATV